MILDLWPASTEDEIKSCFKEVFEQEFSQEDIHKERVNIRVLLEQ